MSAYTYINDNFDICKVELERKTIKYYENDDEIICAQVSRVKDIFHPISPKYKNGTLVLFDYNYGIEIINSNINISLPMSTIWDAHIVDSTLIAVSFKKIYFVDISSGEIQKEISFSPNCYVLKDKKDILFYRIKRNKSYLYLFDTKELIELNNFPKDDSPIVKICHTNDLLHVFAYDRIYVYDIIHQKVISEYNLNFNGMGINYCHCIDIQVDNTCEIKQDECTNCYDLAKALYSKYGAFITMNYLDKNLIYSRQEKFLDILCNMRNLLNWRNNSISNFNELQLLKKKYADFNKQLASIFN